MVRDSQGPENADGCGCSRELHAPLEHMPQDQRFSEVEFNEERHEYRKNGVIYPHVTGILAKAGKCDFSFVDEETRLHSTQRGQSVHWLTQLQDEGALNYKTVPAALRGFRKAWQAWKRHSGFYPIWIEQQFVSHYGFAGTIDRAGSFPASTMFGSGTSAVVDLKTGAIYDWVRYQLCAYTLGVDPRPAIARTIRRIAVRLQADGLYRVREFPMSTWDSDFAEFMRCLRAR
jgi:hypothetical protein